MIPKATGAMVVLAVHIICNSSANGYPFGTGDHGGEPAARETNLDEVADSYPAFAFDDACSVIESEES